MKKNSLPVDVRACAPPSLKTKRLLAVKQSTFISFRLTQRLSSASPEALDGNYISTTFSHKKNYGVIEKNHFKGFYQVLKACTNLTPLNSVACENLLDSYFCPQKLNSLLQSLRNLIGY